MSRQIDERPVGHATSIHGEHLTLFRNPFGVGEVGFTDEGAGPYMRMAGCPNCGKHKDEWWDGITLAAHMNSGIDPSEPCSRVCRYQLEWQTELAARRLQEATP